MNHQLKNDQELQSALIGYGHRRLNRGEIFILAKTIADKLPIGNALVDNIRLYTLNCRDVINSAVYGLTDYIHMPEEDVNRIYGLIDNLLLWRMTVAFQPPALTYSGDPNNVVDETTGILRYVDVSDICAVSEITATANYTAHIFRRYVNTL